MLAHLPWWVCLLIAAIAGAALHWASTERIVIHERAPSQQLATLAVQTSLRGAAFVGQFVLPAILLAGAAASFWRRQHRRNLVDDVRGSRTHDALDGMTWQNFELLVGEGFRRRGFAVTEVGGGGADGGVDLVLRKGGEKYLVQCKQWRAYRVGVEVVRELYGLMAARGATGGFVVTSGRFTGPAIAFAEGRNVELIDGPKLFTMLKRS